MLNTLKYLLFLLILIYAISIYINKDDLLSQKENPIHQEYIEEYRNNIDKQYSSLKDEVGDFEEISFSTAPDGTVGNFEGPQIKLKGIKFFDEFLVKEDGQRVINMDPTSAHFDPDHPNYGLPDAIFSVQDVRLYQPEKRNISNFLGFGQNDNPKPYKIYKKRLESKNSDSIKYLAMQLWLTEFKVNVDMRPDLNPRRLSSSERNKTYPGFWYGSAEPRIELRKLDKEFKDFRYRNLSFILEVTPRNSVTYLRTGNQLSSKADFAVAAIYSNYAKLGDEPEVQRINSNIQQGKPIYLSNNLNSISQNNNSYNFTGILDSDAEKIIELKRLQNENIWNKPYYIEIFFNNIGSWRNGVFNQNKYHDQANLHFIMPIFVVGSWDVIAPQNILPQWNPPPPYIKKFTLLNLLPFWKGGMFGKISSIVLVVVIILIIVSVISPNILKVLKFK